MELKDQKREIRENDRTAPRLGKSEFSTIIISRDLYERWLEKNPNFKKTTYDEFKKIWQDIANEIRSKTCTNALGVCFPSHTGETKIQFLPSKLKAVNISASYELGEKVNELNLNTKGKIAKITWERKKAAMFNKMINLFGFEQDRAFGREVNEALYKNPEIFRTMKILNKKYDKPRSYIDNSKVD